MLVSRQQHVMRSAGDAADAATGPLCQSPTKYVTPGHVTMRVRTSAHSGPHCTRRHAAARAGRSGSFQHSTGKQGTAQRSAARTSHSYESCSHLRMTEVSRPPLYASTTCTAADTGAVRRQQAASKARRHHMQQMQHSRDATATHAVHWGAQTPPSFLLALSSPPTLPVQPSWVGQGSHPLPRMLLPWQADPAASHTAHPSLLFTAVTKHLLAPS